MQRVCHPLTIRSSIADLKRSCDFKNAYKHVDVYMVCRRTLTLQYWRYLRATILENEELWYWTYVWAIILEKCMSYNTGELCEERDNVLEEMDCVWVTKQGWRSERISQTLTDQGSFRQERRGEENASCLKRLDDFGFARDTILRQIRAGDEMLICQSECIGYSEFDTLIAIFGIFYSKLFCLGRRKRMSDDFSSTWEYIETAW